MTVRYAEGKKGPQARALDPSDNKSKGRHMMDSVRQFFAMYKSRLRVSKGKRAIEPKVLSWGLTSCQNLPAAQVTFCG